MNPIQFVNLQKQYAPLKEEILASVAAALDGMHLFLGENVQALEKEFAVFCGCKHGIGVSDGTQALHIILRALEIGPGDEVITVSHTFIATIEAIVLAGAKPVFVDVCPDTYLMDPGQLESKITEHTRALLPVHLYGQAAEMDPILAVARRHGLKVIEDACQAHGAAYRRERAGSFGDAAAFSFYFSKNLGAYGEGGFITTDNDELAHRMRMIRDHGSDTRYHHEILGWNARLDEIQAAILRIKLRHLEQYIELRQKHAAQYNHLLQYIPVIPPYVSPEASHNYHLYVIQAERRDDLQAYLKSKGIATGIHYPIPCHLQKSMASLQILPGSLPVTEALVQKILSLPMYPELEEQEIEYVAENICDFYRTA